MAELVGGAFLSSILNVAFDRLSSPEAVNWIRGKKLDHKLATLKATLYAAQALLNDAENKQIKDPAVKDWLSDLKAVVYKADDLLDEFSTKAATQKDPGNFLSRYLNLQNRELANRMEDIINAAESILKNKDALGLKEIPKEDMSWRVTTSLVEVSDVIGRDEDKEAIIKLLLDDTNNGGEISVIPIIGQGGIGKSTLAQLVYHDDRVKQNFNFRAWVCVSEEFDVIKVTRTILQAINRSSGDVNDLDLLQHDLKENLARKKFFVVMDDAWNENYNDWNKLLKPFQHGIKGSKILLTTRSSKVASAVQTVPPHQLSLLSDEDCWLVFAKHALFSTDSMEYPTLVKIGREIVNRCNGLPLAAQTLGGMLRGNNDVKVWNHVLKSEIWEFSDERSKIIPALRISYYYLPPHLKECFVFCSLYPKDYEFDRHDLILLWMAENFIQPMGRRTLEEVGYEYFDELVARSFFQRLSTEDNVFVMHDLIHDLATLYAGEFYFRAEELGKAADIGIKTLHLSHNAKGDYPMSKLLAACDKVKYTRTFLEMNLNQYVPFNMENAPCILLSHLRCLRVLSFKLFPLEDESLPHSLGEMIHLRYLDFSKTPILTLPESMSNLYNLQILKLKRCRKLKMLPSGMQDLINLRHLDIRETDIKEMPRGMSKLKHLRLLSNFIVGKDEENGIRELGGLENLRGSLSISELQNVINSGQALEARMGEKKHIDNLHFSWSSSGDIADSQIERDILDKLAPHTDLKELSINGYMGTIFPEWLGRSSYHKITKMKLSGCRNCCMLPSLGQLPSLKHLKISKFQGLKIIGAEFYKIDDSCCETPFPSLEFLKFSGLSCCQEWHSLEFDAFPRLELLIITKCPVLTGDLPRHLPTLQNVTIRECNQLACSLPIAPAIIGLHINGANEVRIQELPLSLRGLSIGGRQLTSLQSSIISETESSLATSFSWACLPVSLKSLSISNGENLQVLMQQPNESLESLEIEDSDSLTSLQLNAFPNLTGLCIRRCGNLKSIEVLQSQSQNAALSSLRYLEIDECQSFVSFPALGMAAHQLEDLTIKRCPEIDSFPERGLPLNLRYLTISWLASMDLHGLGLTSLYIQGACESVKSFPKEGCLPASLETLIIFDFPSLETLDSKGFVHLNSLQYLTILNCPKLKNIVGETLPASLIQLSIHESPLLGERCRMKDPQIWPKISHIRNILVDRKWIW